MKSSKSTKVKPAKEEECGIWLDTKELKEKKQARTRPVSRYSLSLALSFTQSKLNMAVSRQSSISSFFSPKPTDPNRSAAPAGTTHTSPKRKHHMTTHSSGPTPEVRRQSWDGSGKPEKEQRFFHLICGEEDEPPEKRRHVSTGVLETQEASPGPKDEDKHYQELPVLTSRPVNEHSRAIASHRTQASPRKRMGKENSCPASPIQNTPPSPFKRRLMSSPGTHRLKETHTRSPGKHVSETLASLFTQDSEGLCVIAHRDRRSPAEEEEEEEEEVLFTQDSEGNMVIKH